MVISLLVMAGVLVSPANACETCAAFQATSLRERKAESWNVALSEQYTDYQRAGAGVPNSVLRDGELLKSYSTTELDVSYDLSNSFGIELSLPFIVRTFEERSAYRSDDETESGLGDSSLLVSVSPYSDRQIEHAVHTSVYAGLKLPTGDTGSLGDQLDEGRVDRLGVKHHTAGGVQGRILSLGSGSWDTFAGFAALGRVDRSVLLVSGEYAIRTEGDFDYRFANDFVWSAGPAYYLLLDDDFSLALQALVSGEHKGKDVQAGAKVDGTAATHLFAGPSLFLASGGRLSAEIAVELPFYTDDPGAAVVPELRVRGALVYLF